MESPQEPPPVHNAQKVGQLESELASAREELQRRSAELDRLGRWIEQLFLDLQAVLNSRRWKLGDFLIEGLFKRIMLRPNRGKPWAPEHAAEIIEAYRNWKEESRRRSDVAAVRRGMPARTDLPSATSSSYVSPFTGSTPPTVDLIVCVHDALEDVEACLESIDRCATMNFRRILIDDGSGEATRRLLADYASRDPNRVLIVNDTAEGYTRAANRGLRASTADYAILLNSDTVVTPFWMEKLLECGESAKIIGIAGPLSNAASWQSIPEVTDLSGDWAVNALPDGASPAQVAEVLVDTSERRFPRVPFLNGFCIAIKRAVIERVGLLDEETFPRGYGEEDDFCLRAAATGFECAIADHAYVYHAKSRSFGHLGRRELAREGWKKLNAKHGARQIEELTHRMRDEPTLAALRAKLAARLNADSSAK